MWFQDLFFLVLWPSVFFTAPPSMSSTRTYEFFFLNLVYTYDVTFFSSSTAAVKHTVRSIFFVHISLFFEARLKPIAASATLIEKSTTLEYLPCLYTRAHGEY